MSHSPTGSVRLLALLLLTGCGGYADTSEAFRRHLTAGQPHHALAKVDKALGVDKPEDLPEPGGEDTNLLLLERATILQALGRYKLSSRDFQVADKKLDVLDLTNDTAGDIGKYLFSDDATVYKAPPHEKLLINTMNMINYLVTGNAQGAKIEARRFTVNRKYLDGEGEKGKAMLALGSYLAGFAFEVAGESDAAMRHYGDAFQAGSLPGLERAAKQLSLLTGAKDQRLKGSLANPIGAAKRIEAQLLIITQAGMAPFKVSKRLPIGAAVVAASRPRRGARLSSKQRSRANTFAAKGVLKWVNYPGLNRVRGGRGRVSVAVDGKSISGGVALDVEDRVVEQFEDIKGSLIAASITRLLSRAIAGTGAQAATRKASGSGIAGLLMGLAVEGALTAADTPDTRSWVTLPGRVHVARTRLPPGKHTVAVRYRGIVRTAEVDLKPGGWAALNFSDLR